MESIFSMRRWIRLREFMCCPARLIRKCAPSSDGSIVDTPLCIDPYWPASHPVNVDAGLRPALRSWRGCEGGDLMAESLVRMRCVACRKGEPTVTDAEVAEYQPQV